MAGGERRGRPVNTGDSKAIRDLLGPDAGGARGDFDLPPGYENPYEVDRRQRAAERRLNSPAAQARAAAANGPAPGPAGAGGARGARGAGGARARGGPKASGRSRSSGNLGIRRAARQASVANPTGGKLPIGLTAGSGAAGLLFGAIAYALVLSVVDYGPSGPLLWFKAKFLNEPAGAASSSTSSASGSTAGGARVGGVASPAQPTQGVVSA